MRGCRALTAAEFQQILRCSALLFPRPVAARNNTLWTVMAHTGLRIGEARTLRLQDVDRAGRVMAHLLLPRRRTKTKHASRMIPLHSDARVALENWISTAALFGLPGGWLFPASRGPCCKTPQWFDRPISDRGARKCLDRVVAVAGISGRVSTHSFRKTFAANIYRELEHDLFATQAALGHENIGSTIRYLQVNQERIAAGILRLTFQ